MKKPTIKVTTETLIRVKNLNDKIKYVQRMLLQSQGNGYCRVDLGLMQQTFHRESTRERVRDVLRHECDMLRKEITDLGFEVEELS